MSVIYGESRNAAPLTCDTLVRSCSLVDAVEGVAQVVGRGRCCDSGGRCGRMAHPRAGVLDIARSARRRVHDLYRRRTRSGLHRSLTAKPLFSEVWD
jgi:hypothetical protein